MAADWKDLAVSIDARLKACCAMPISNFGAAFNKEVQDDLLPRLEKTTCARLLIVGGRDTNFLTVTQLSAHWSCRVRVAEVGDVSRFHSELGSE